MDPNPLVDGRGIADASRAAGIEVVARSAGRRGAPAERRLRAPRHHRHAVRGPEDGRLARRQGRRPRRLVPVDHRRGGPRRRASAAGLGRRDRGRSRHGGRRRPAAHRPRPRPSRAPPRRCGSPSTRPAACPRRVGSSRAARQRSWPRPTSRPTADAPNGEAAGAEVATLDRDATGGVSLPGAAGRARQARRPGRPARGRPHPRVERDPGRGRRPGRLVPRPRPWWAGRTRPARWAARGSHRSPTRCGWSSRVRRAARRRPSIGGRCSPGSLRSGARCARRTDHRLEVACRTVPRDSGVGASVAVNGVCLTVVERGEDRLAFDVSPETLSRSSLRRLAAGRPREPRASRDARDATGRPPGAGARGRRRRGRRRLATTAREGPSSRSASRRISCATWSRRARSPSTASASRWRPLHADGVDVALIPHTLAVTTFGRRTPGRPREPRGRRDREVRGQERGQVRGKTARKERPMSETVQDPAGTAEDARRPSPRSRRRSTTSGPDGWCSWSTTPTGRTRATSSWRPRRRRPHDINFMVTHGRGIVCLPVAAWRLDELGIQQMVSDGSSDETAFTVSIDYRPQITTGTSAHDRAVTARAIADPAVKAAGLPEARSRLPAAREGGRGPASRGAHRGGGRPGDPCRHVPGRRDLRGHASGRHHGAPARARSGSRGSTA